MILLKNFENEIQCVKTGIKSLDDMRILAKGELTCIFGTGEYKKQIALNILVRVAKSGVPSLFVCGKDGAKEIAKRIIDIGGLFDLPIYLSDSCINENGVIEEVKFAIKTSNVGLVVIDDIDGFGKITMQGLFKALREIAIKHVVCVVAVHSLCAECENKEIDEIDIENLVKVESTTSIIGLDKFAVYVLKRRNHSGKTMEYFKISKGVLKESTGL